MLLLCILDFFSSSFIPGRLWSMSFFRNPSPRSLTHSNHPFVFTLSSCCVSNCFALHLQCFCLPVPCCWLSPIVSRPLCVRPFVILTFSSFGMFSSSLLSLYVFRLVLFVLPRRSRIFGFFFKDFINDSSSLRSCGSCYSCLIECCTYSLCFVLSLSLFFPFVLTFSFFFFLTHLLSWIIIFFTFVSSQNTSYHFPNISYHHYPTLSPLQIFFFTELPGILDLENAR